VLLVRRIRELLYEEGFTIQGARSRLGHGMAEAVPPAAGPTIPLSPVIDLALLRREIQSVVSLLKS